MISIVFYLLFLYLCTGIKENNGNTVFSLFCPNPVFFRLYFGFEIFLFFFLCLCNRLYSIYFLCRTNFTFRSFDNRKTKLLQSLSLYLFIFLRFPSLLMFFFISSPFISYALIERVRAIRRIDL